MHRRASIRLSEKANAAAFPPLILALFVQVVLLSNRKLEIRPMFHELRTVIEGRIVSQDANSLAFAPKNESTILQVEHKCKIPATLSPQHAFGVQSSSAKSRKSSSKNKDYTLRIFTDYLFGPKKSLNNLRKSSTNSPLLFF